MRIKTLSVSLILLLCLLLIGGYFLSTARTTYYEERRVELEQEAKAAAANTDLRPVPAAIDAQLEVEKWQDFENGSFITAQIVLVLLAFTLPTALAIWSVKYHHSVWSLWLRRGLVTLSLPVWLLTFKGTQSQVLVRGLLAISIGGVAAWSLWDDYRKGRTPITGARHSAK